VRPVRFVLFATGSALVWGAAWSGAGYLFTEAIVR
jgi:hypothetical protein